MEFRNYLRATVIVLLFLFLGESLAERKARFTRLDNLKIIGLNVKDLLFSTSEERKSNLKKALSDLEKLSRTKLSDSSYSLVDPYLEKRRVPSFKIDGTGTVYSLEQVEEDGKSIFNFYTSNNKLGTHMRLVDGELDYLIVDGTDVLVNGDNVSDVRRRFGEAGLPTFLRGESVGKECLFYSREPLKKLSLFTTRGLVKVQRTKVKQECFDEDDPERKFCSDRQHFVRPTKNASDCELATSDLSLALDAKQLVARKEESPLKVVESWAALGSRRADIGWEYTVEENRQFKWEIQKELITDGTRKFSMNPTNLKPEHPYIGSGVAETIGKLTYLYVKEKGVWFYDAEHPVFFSPARNFKLLGTFRANGRVHIYFTARLWDESPDFHILWENSFGWYLISAEDKDSDAPGC